jgi:regulator of nucleoside diphosphate kinase
MGKNIVITRPDMHRLEQLVESSVSQTDAGRTLEYELDRAIVVDPERISEKVVTMNSRVRILDMDRDSELVVTVVFPFEANAQQNKVSVLAPLGTALLGCRVGETVKFNAPGGTRRIKIIAIEYQPEAAARQHMQASDGAHVGA